MACVFVALFARFWVGRSLVLQLFVPKGTTTKLTPKRRRRALHQATNVPRKLRRREASKREAPRMSTSAEQKAKLICEAIHGRGVGHVNLTFFSKTGNGKSSSATSVLEVLGSSEQFKAGGGIHSETKSPLSKEVKVGALTLRLTDQPGLFDTKGTGSIESRFRFHTCKAQRRRQRSIKANGSKEHGRDQNSRGFQRRIFRFQSRKARYHRRNIT